MHVVILGVGSHARMLLGTLQRWGDTGELRELGDSIESEELAIIGVGLTAMAARRERFLKTPREQWTRAFAPMLENVGTFVGPQVVLGINVKVGDNVIIYSGAILEHDTVIADHAFLGPGVVCCGGVTVGEGALIGANATLLPNIGVGPWAVVGAGAVVTRDVPSGVTVKGVPAR